MAEGCVGCERLAVAETEVSGLQEAIKSLEATIEALRADIGGLRMEYATAKGGLLMARWLWGAGGAALALLGFKVLGSGTPHP